MGTSAPPARAPDQYRRLTHAHTAATGVTRQGAPAPDLSTASNGPSETGDDERHASTTVHPPARPSPPDHGQRPQPPATRTGQRRRGPSCRNPRQRHAVANEFLSLSHPGVWSPRRENGRGCWSWRAGVRSLGDLACWVPGKPVMLLCAISGYACLTWWGCGERGRRPELSGSVTEITDAPRCHQSPPGFARPFSEVQRQFLRGWWLPGRADRRQGHALRAPDSELTMSVPGP